MEYGSKQEKRGKDSPKKKIEQLQFQLKNRLFKNAEYMSTQTCSGNASGTNKQQPRIFCTPNMQQMPAYPPCKRIIQIHLTRINQVSTLVNVGAISTNMLKTSALLTGHCFRKYLQIFLINKLF